MFTMVEKRYHIYSCKRVIFVDPGEVFLIHVANMIVNNHILMSLDTKLWSFAQLHVSCATKTPKTNKIVRKVYIHWWFIDDLIGKNPRGVFIRGAFIGVNTILYVICDCP